MDHTDVREVRSSCDCLKDKESLNWPSLVELVEHHAQGVEEGACHRGCFWLSKGDFPLGHQGIIEDELVSLFRCLLLLDLKETQEFFSKVGGGEKDTRLRHGSLNVGWDVPDLLTLLVDSFLVLSNSHHCRR